MSKKKEFKYELPELRRDSWHHIEKGKAKVYIFLEHPIIVDPPDNMNTGHILGIQANKEGYEYLATYFAMMALNDNVSDGFHIHISEDDGDLDYLEDSDNVIELTLYNPKYGRNIKKKK